MLGVVYDPGMYMEECISRLCCDASWKIKTIQRTGRYFNMEEMIHLYKSKVLGYIEYRTGAIYHAAAGLLANVDNMQRSFLKSIGMSKETAMFDYNLSPLETRRDIALLGVIHRTVLGNGPDQFKAFFKFDSAAVQLRNRHGMQLITHRKGKFLDVLGVSILGLVDVYNLLPECAVQAKSVKDFQTLLQQLVKYAATWNISEWWNLLSPRHTLHLHPVNRWFKWTPKTVVYESDDTKWYDEWNDGTLPTRLFAF